MTLPSVIRNSVAIIDQDQCAYCRTQTKIVGQALEIDHIMPKSQGGDDILSNLCQACMICNRHKAAKTMAIDPQTNKNASLFHPRRQQWSDHFSWSKDGVRILGLTPVGRATVIALHMNNDKVIRSRQIWVAWGYHPPKD